MDSIPTVTVTVRRPVETDEADEMGNPVLGEPETEEVEGVVCDPTASSSLSGNLTMRGVEVDADFHFPNDYEKSLRGCEIEYAGHVYSVIGDPRPYAASPLAWNRQVPAREVT